MILNFSFVPRGRCPSDPLTFLGGHYGSSGSWNNSYKRAAHYLTSCYIATMLIAQNCISVDTTCLASSSLLKYTQKPVQVGISMRLRATLSKRCHGTTWAFAWRTKHNMLNISGTVCHARPTAQNIVKHALGLSTTNSVLRGKPDTICNTNK